MTSHDGWMREALALGEQAAGLSSPNPPVGAVVVRDGEVVGRGHTQAVGGAHAEVMALREAGERAKGATVVCTLEPCAHTGRTGPCVEALIAADVAAVAYAVADPTAAAGGGHQRLENAGIAVTGGVLADDAASGALRGWLFAREHTRPYVIWKVGESLDGQVAAEDGSSRWITSPQSRAEVHRLRAKVDAIVAGAGTVRADDPQLTAREPDGAAGPRQPLRVLLSSLGKLPAHARALDESAPTLVAVGPDAPRDRTEALREAGAEVWRSSGRAGEGIDLDALLGALYERGVLTVLVEGGPTVAGSFAGAGLIDEVLAYIAPKLLVSGMWPALRGYGMRSIDDAIDLDIVDVQRIGPDVRITATPRHRDRE